MAADTIAVDYAGDPKAKTRNRAEDVIRDMAGTAWVDEQDRVLTRVEGHFVNTFKIGSRTGRGRIQKDYPLLDVVQADQGERRGLRLPAVLAWRRLGASLASSSTSTEASAPCSRDYPQVPDVQHYTSSRRRKGRDAGNPGRLRKALQSGSHPELKGQKERGEDSRSHPSRRTWLNRR